MPRLRLSLSVALWGGDVVRLARSHHDSGDSSDVSWTGLAAAAGRLSTFLISRVLGQYPRLYAFRTKAHPEQHYGS